MSESEGQKGAPEASEPGDTVSESEGRGAAWTEERRRSDEGRRCLKGAPEASEPGDTVSGAGDFDFLVGSWDVANRRRKHPLTGSDDWDEFPSTSECRSLFGGAANLDEFSVPARGFSGLTLRLFDPDREEWSLHWASSRDGRLQPPVTGSFAGGTGTFYSRETYNGADITVRFIWSGISLRSARWEQAFSPDGGNTWETNWIMEFTRREPAA